MFNNIGAPELLIILAILLLLFGAAKLPKLARSLGQSAGELKKGMNEVVSDKKTSASSAKEDK